MSDKCVLAIDTSCYTTSVAVVDDRKKVRVDTRKVLTVPHGRLGLQQAQGVFQHVQNLPGLILETWGEVPPDRITAVVSTARPRPVNGSYMPVFTVGSAFGNSLASAMQVPFFESTHQENHIQAGIARSGLPYTEEFLVIHFSGGTSELLKVKRESGERRPFSINILGGTTDLCAGQFIDRVGVKLGFAFPAGPSLENLAGECTGESTVTIPSSVQGYSVSFSGPETHAQRLIARGIEPKDICRAVEKCIAATLEKIVRKAVNEYGLRDVLFVGGVMANRYIKDRLVLRLEHPAVGARLHFCDPHYSRDNAVGAALIGLGFLAGTDV